MRNFKLLWLCVAAFLILGFWDKAFVLSPWYPNMFGYISSVQDGIKQNHVEFLQKAQSALERSSLGNRIDRESLGTMIKKLIDDPMILNNFYKLSFRWRHDFKDISVRCNPEGMGLEDVSCKGSSNFPDCSYIGGLARLLLILNRKNAGKIADYDYFAKEFLDGEYDGKFRHISENIWGDTEESKEDFIKRFAKGSGKSEDEIRKSIEKFEESNKEVKKRADEIKAALKEKGLDRFASQLLVDANIKSGDEALRKAQELNKIEEEAKKRADDITAKLKNAGLERFTSQMLADANIKTGDEAVRRAQEWNKIEEAKRAQQLKVEDAKKRVSAREQEIKDAIKKGEEKQQEMLREINKALERQKQK
jgi:hypothetical protein